MQEKNSRASKAWTVKSGLYSSKPTSTAYKNRGKAQLGDKTFLDGLHPAVEVLASGAPDMKAAASLAAKAAKEAFLATKGMLAKHGRMAIRGEQSREYLDPGAAVAALLMDGFAQTMLR